LNSLIISAFGLNQKIIDHCSVIPIVLIRNVHFPQTCISLFSREISAPNYSGYSMSSHCNHGKILMRFSLYSSELEGRGCDHFDTEISIHYHENPWFHSVR
jgi:hypothetical protein